MVLAQYRKMTFSLGCLWKAPFGAAGFSQRCNEAEPSETPGHRGHSMRLAPLGAAGNAPNAFCRP